jgi:hypothetical protein
MRLMGGAPVHRINLRARTNHANCSGNSRRPQMTVTIDAARTPVTLAVSGNGLPQVNVRI